MEDEIFEFFENLVAEIDTCTCVFYAFPFSVSFSFLPLFVLCVQKKKDTISCVVSSCEIYGRILSKFEIRRLLRVDLFFFSFRVYIKF